MPWFTSKGQILQTAFTFIALVLAGYKAFPDMQVNNFFSLGAIIFYLLVGSVLVSSWFVIKSVYAGGIPGRETTHSQMSWTAPLLYGLAVAIGLYLLLVFVGTPEQQSDPARFSGGRHFTPKQRALLIQRLKDQDKGYLLTISTEKAEGTDLVGYMVDFVEVFGEAGWKPHLEWTDNVRDHIWIYAKKNDPVADLLSVELRKPDIGVEVQRLDVEDPSWKENTIEMSIGRVR